MYTIFFIRYSAFSTVSICDHLFLQLTLQEAQLQMNFLPIHDIFRGFFPRSKFNKIIYDYSNPVWTWTDKLWFNI